MFLNAVAISASIALLTSSSVSAHRPDKGPRAGGSKTQGHVKRAASSATDWSAEASITNSADECTPYYIAEVDSLASSYPTIWSVASIVPSDTYASSLFSAIQTGIPNISPRGTSNGDFSGVTYDDSTDPDCWWTATGCDQPKLEGIPADIITCPEAKTWGLSFDDGPNCTHNEFYDFLAENNQKATLCYIGSNVLDWPLQAQRGIADGHHVISHTWSHLYMTSLTNEQVFAELYYTAKAIKDIMGISVDAWRPPFGDIDDRVRYIATQLGLKSILWDQDTDDWQVLPLGTLPVSTVEENYDKIIANVSSEHGTIVLTHEINQGTMDLFMDSYTNISGAYTHIVPLTACMNWTNPYQEDISYPTFEEYTSGTTLASGLPTTFSISAATYSPYLGGGSSVVVNEGAATASTTSSSSSGSSKKTTANSSASASGSSGSTAATSGSMGLAQPLLAAAIAVAGGASLVLFA